MRKNILIIDDDLTFLEYMKKIVPKNLYNIHSTTSANHALKRIQTSSINLILCDIKMPVFDGYQLIWSIRSEEKYKKNKDVPIIAITNLSGNIVQAKLQEIGSDAWVSKQVSKEKLLRILKEHT